MAQALLLSHSMANDTVPSFWGRPQWVSWSPAGPAGQWAQESSPLCLALPLLLSEQAVALDVRSPDSWLVATGPTGH